MKSRRLGQASKKTPSSKRLPPSQLFEGWVIADDSGLEVDALGGASRSLLGTIRRRAASDSENNALLLKNLKKRS